MAIVQDFRRGVPPDLVLGRDPGFEYGAELVISPAVDPRPLDFDLCADTEQTIETPFEILADTLQEITAPTTEKLNEIGFDPTGQPVLAFKNSKTQFAPGSFHHGPVPEGVLPVEKVLAIPFELLGDTEQIVVSAALDTRIRYMARLFDSAGALIAVLNTTKEPNFKRVPGQANQFSFSLAATDDKIPFLELAVHAEIWRFDERILAGRITDRDFSKSPYQFKGLTNEVYLSDDPLLITPEAWNKYEGWEAADVVRDLIKGFRSVTLSQKADWEVAGTTRTKVDTTTLAGNVILAKQSGLTKYEPAGSFTSQAIDLGSDVVSFDRVRWAQDVGADTRITVQTASSSDGVNWSAWTAEREAPGGDAGLGLVIESPFGRYIKIRANLYTTNTTETDESGNPRGRTPVLKALQIVARYPSRLHDAGIPTSFGKVVRGLELNRTSFIEAFQKISDKTGLEWCVTEDFGILFAAQLGSNLDDLIVLIEGENAVIQAYQDKDDFCNVITGWGAGDGVDQLRTPVLRHEASIQLYGYEKAGSYENKDLATMSELITATQAELDKRAYPTPSISVRVAAKNPDWPDFGLYDTIRLVSKKRGLNLICRIVEESRQDGSNGEIVTLGLNSRIRNIMEQVALTQRQATQALGRPGETTAPASPFNLSATGGYGQIQLTWTGRYDSVIVEASTDALTWTILDPAWRGNSFTHAGLPKLTRYYYRITGVKNGVKSATVGPVSAVTTDTVDAGQITTTQINIAFAAATSASGSSPTSLIRAATSKDDFNEIEVAIPDGDAKLVCITHNSLGVLAGLPVIAMYQTGGTESLAWGFKPYNELYVTSIGDSSFAVGFQEVTPDATWLLVRRLSGTVSSVRIRMKRHAVA